MIPVLTAQEMRDADAEASAAVSASALMHAAGEAVAAFLMQSAPARVVAFAGPGNNGGDAYAAFARMDRAVERVIYGVHDVTGSPTRSDARARARATGVRFAELPSDDDGARKAVEGADWCVDALFGTGARLPVEARYEPAVRALDARQRRVLSIDVPTGTDATSGAVSDCAVRATATVTLGAMKAGLLLEPARALAGELWIAAIGISQATLQRHARHFSALDDGSFLRLLPVRAAESDKRASGAPLVIAGSQQFPGAAVLCAHAAARAGAGYVTLATAPAAAPVLRAHLVEQVVVTYDDAGSPSEAANDLLQTAKRNSSVALGPGLGLDDWTGEMVRAFVERCDLPIVIDASGLFHFSKRLELLRAKRCVLTPHAGEFARLSGKGTIAPGERVARLREFVARTGITTLLKGASTLIDDGTVVRINPTGTSALATAGTGDVLTGMIATLLAQGLSPIDAATAGAYWHGLAGRLAARERRVGVVAGDVIEHLAAAIPAEPKPGPLLRYA